MFISSHLVLLKKKELWEKAYVKVCPNFFHCFLLILILCVASKLFFCIVILWNHRNVRTIAMLVVVVMKSFSWNTTIQKIHWFVNTRSSFMVISWSWSSSFFCKKHSHYSPSFVFCFNLIMYNHKSYQQWFSSKEIEICWIPLKPHLEDRWCVWVCVCVFLHEKISQFFISQNQEVAECLKDILCEQSISTRW